MSQDVGILISQPGKDTNTAVGSQILMATSAPFIKIDTQNVKGFQTITLLITTEPPAPVGPSFLDVYTVLYKFKHSYAYVPTIETLFVVTVPAVGQTSTTYQQYFYDYGLLASVSVAGIAELYACADATWVYFIIHKQNADGISPVFLSGTTVSITSHVFVDDIGV